MSNIVITCDSTSDLSAELYERYGIKVLPLGVTLGDKAFKDGVDITPDEIYAHHSKTGELPKTTAANMDECLNFFKQFTDEGKTVIHFSISSSMSSTFNNARLAAMELENVYAIDSMSLSTGEGLLVITAAEMAQQGMAAEDIVAKIEELKPCVDASFVIDNLEYLHKGGRCSAVAMLGANLLKLKPCIVVKDGAMGVEKKYRGRYADVLKEYVKERVGNGEDIYLDRVFVTHAGCDPEIVEMVINEVKAAADFKEVLLTRAGCTVSSHCGANTLGVLFIRKHPIN